MLKQHIMQTLANLYKKFKIPLDIVLVLLVYTFLHKVFIETVIPHLPESIFTGGQSFVFGAFGYWPFTVSVFAIVLGLGFLYRQSAWDQLENRHHLKIFMLILCFAIFWEQAFYDYNFYLNTDFLVDKAFLLIFAALVLIHPSFLFLYIIVGLVIWKSLMFPLGYFHWTDIRPAFEIILLFVAFLLTRGVKNVNTSIFIFLAITLHAANYVAPGIAKIEISPNGWEWTFLDNLNNLFVSSYINGWLAFIDEKMVLQIASILDKTEIVITILTMAIQLGALFLLYTRRISIFFFIAFELLHLGIFFASGIFFWAWIIVNLGFIYLVKELSKSHSDFLYDKSTFILFIIVVFLSPLYYKSVPLGWWDIRVNTTYDFYATLDDNKTIKLNKNDFSPYDTVFTQNRFYYLDPDTTFASTYGCVNLDTSHYSNIKGSVRDYIFNNGKAEHSPHSQHISWQIYTQLENANDLNTVIRIMATEGKNLYSEERKQAFATFVRNYFRNYNAALNKHQWYHKLGAPYHIYDTGAPRLKDNIKIYKITVVKSNAWYDKENLKIERFGRKKIMEIIINES